ncbi:hypothetical protein Tco_0982862, partial [Tanacetum coccineum]
IASASNPNGIQVKDIVKEVEDYLKTYSSAGMDINWFLVYLDGLEPYPLEILENGPFMPKSPTSTSKNVLIKPQKQWSPEDKKLVNQDKRLKRIIISCLPNDIMKYVIKCTTTISMWNDLILALEGEKESDSDFEEDTISTKEFLAGLKQEFHDRALLANQKRFYKRSGRVGSARKPMDKSNETCFASFMAIAEDEPAVGKADARSENWIEITMKKVHRLLSMNDGDERKHVLDYTNVDLHYVEDQKKNLLMKQEEKSRMGFGVGDSCRV